MLFAEQFHWQKQNNPANTACLICDWIDALGYFCIEAYAHV